MLPEGLLTLWPPHPLLRVRLHPREELLEGKPADGALAVQPLQAQVDEVALLARYESQLDLDHGSSPLLVPPCKTRTVLLLIDMEAGPDSTAGGRRNASAEGGVKIGAI